ncbi:nicotinate-nucleotide adenylyltransferase [Siculibacillus lacustris]|uniref:Probable nicotinate-nucleotide adenylyltransferase n=1 Tax=Siculibacillus lacustris TaxID=1549641 RepID=A0A4Q9VY54_9HYPH|nr:nicotinate-nucleotide adenylyltransferase [Siculibacillus lacustris]
MRIPPTAPGLRIGLLGGSFNPPHRGHFHVAETALARLGLDALWVMVTPGNPLKPRDDLPSLATRIDAARRLMDHPRITVTAFEAHFGSPYTWRTVERLAAMHPQVRFVWVMGADNLASFHRWQHWRRIAGTVPIAVIDRPGASMTPLSAPAALAYARHRLPEIDAARLADRPAPAWTFLHAPRNALSSTDLRRRGLAG